MRVSAAKWNFVNFQSPTYSALMMEYVTPPSYGSSVVNVGGIAVEGKILSGGSDNKATHTKAVQDTDIDWPEPQEVDFTWNGKSKEGDSVSAHLHGSLGKRLDRIDVMAKIPGFIKSIVGGVVGTKPYIYQVSKHPSRLNIPTLILIPTQYSPQPNLSIKVTVGGHETTEEGVLFTEATFIS